MPPSAPPAAVETQVPPRIQTLANLVVGCRDDHVDGISAKISLVKSFIASGGEDLLNVVFWLHLQRSITIDSAALLDAVRWQKPISASRGATRLAPVSEAIGSTGAGSGGTGWAVQDAGRPGMFVASALAECPVSDMGGVVASFIARNPQVNIIDLLRYVNRRGFMKVDAATLLSPPVISWKQPPPHDIEPPTWTRIWVGDAPAGLPTYTTVRDARGHTASVAFLGAIDDTGAHPSLATPVNVLLEQWKLPKPAMCINADAGSYHPRQADSLKMLANLPQFCDIYEEFMLADAEKKRQKKIAIGKAALAAASATPGASTGLIVPSSKTAPAPAALAAPAQAEAPPTQASTPPAVADASSAKKAKGRKIKDRVAPRRILMPEPPPIIDLEEVMNRSLTDWQASLKEIDTDAMMNDASLNNLIYDKLKDTFCALLDAAAVAGSWVVVDRTRGGGSAAAELLIEQALCRGAQRPIIVAIDSLERLGKARKGSQSHAMVQQLSSLFANENASQFPNGTEKEQKIDFFYHLDDFASSARFHKYVDPKLPFAVFDEHRRKDFGGTCDPARKWCYFYMDGLFSSASHYVIKNNDWDDFDVESIARTGYLYAHGDMTTYKRLRQNIQQGKPIVMLHNSGGVVTAFSWLQRVMAFARPPPPAETLRGPLKFLVANLSRASWAHDFGMPEIIMMKGLADRAPHLFRTTIVSCDILTDNEEQTLELITACFASNGGLPALGLGNAEVNVIFNAWKLHITLCENARRFFKVSVMCQIILWTLAIVTTFCSIFIVSIDSGSIFRYFDQGGVLSPFLRAPLGYAVLVLPIVTAVISTVSTRLLWRDKWSVCHTAASQLTFEIYKFRTSTLEYDLSKPMPMDHDSPKLLQSPLSAKQKAQKARQIFVERVQSVYLSAVAALSEGNALKRKQTKISVVERQEYRRAQEKRPTLNQWYNIKRHAERHFYNTAWAFPRNAFLSWLSGLVPYLQQRIMREELRSVIEELVKKKKVVLNGKPLRNSASTRIRRALANSLGLPAGALEMQKEEIIAAQRELVVQLYKEKLEEQKLAAAEEKAAPEVTLAKVENGGFKGSKEQPKKGTTKKKPIVKLGPERSEDEETFTDAKEAMSKFLMAMQGLKHGKLTLKEKNEQKKKTKENRLEAKPVDDDYLFGPLSLESYVTWRLRPLIEHLEKQAFRLSVKLSFYEILGFVVNSLGAALAVVQMTEWVSLTVALAAILAGVIEFTQMRNQLVSNNLALRDLQKLLVKWDSLSVASRRSDAMKTEFVDITERAILMVVSAQTTAASSTQSNAYKSQEMDHGEEQEE